MALAALLWLLGNLPDTMAQGPEVPIPQQSPNRLMAISLSSLPYAAAATFAAIAFLIIFNQKLQREVRERKAAERKLRRAEREKAVLLDSIAENVVYLDTDLRILWANRNARKEPRFRSQSSMGDHCYAIWGGGNGKPCKHCPVPKSLAKGVPQQNHAVRDPDGRRWQIRAYPVKNDNGVTTGIVVISRDVTEMLAKQEEQLQSRKLESVGVLAGGIAHDFNNMLTAIMGYVSLAELQQQPASQTRTYLEKAAEAANRAKQLAIRLLTFSHGGHPLRRQAVVADLLQDAVRSAVDGHPVSIRMTVDPQCRLLWCDTAQIRQAIENVIVNACESMPNGGEVLVEADCTDIEEGVGGVRLPGGYLRISVSDRGAGIPKEIRDKIFDPYFTTKPMGAQKGSGLGLAITHSIVQKHQGYVSVSARPDQGTRVDLFLPLEFAGNQSAAVTSPTEEKQQQTQGGRILVLEDETMVWEVAEMLLSHLGYRVTHATNGEAAVELYERAMADGKPYDTVILDLTIKGGMGGRETLEALKRIDPDVFAFVSSGYSSDPVLTDFRRFGFRGVIPKPYTLEEVKAALAERTKAPTTSRSRGGPAG
ncbi:MAG: ATP-binding protein [Desulfosarcinaceae bacterium]|nr:ATP-binding protein [Desulfosarcinaceae bacterium]